MFEKMFLNFDDLNTTLTKIGTQYFHNGGLT